MDPSGIIRGCPEQLGTPANSVPAAFTLGYRAVFDALPQIAGILDAAGIVRYANNRWCRYTGTDTDEHGLPHPSLLVEPEDIQATAAVLAAIATNAEVRCELSIRGADRRSQRHEVRIVPIDGGENVARWMFTCTEIPVQRATISGLEDLAARIALSAENERVMAARLLEKTRLMAIVERMAHVGDWRLDLTADDMFWSDEVRKTFGLPATYEPTLEKTIARYHPSDRASMSATLDEAISEGTPFTHEARIVRPDGSVRHVVSYGQPECGRDGAVLAIVGCLQDVTEAKLALRERERLVERVNLATQAAQVGIWDLDMLSGVVEWDSVMFRLHGLDRASGPAMYQQWVASLHADDRAAAEHELAQAASGGSAFNTEFRVIWPNGEVHNIRAMAHVVRDAEGLVERMIGTNWDVTAARTLADELRQEKDLAADAAGHDALTGLLNRRGLETWIDSRPAPHATLLYLDVDGFKAVNDRGGHAAGDETLRVIARIVKDAVRELDACARIGGDEFVVVLLGKIAPEATCRIVARITAAVGSLRPLGPGDDTRIGMSIGIGRLSGAGSVGDALREADTDLYRCKSERKRLAGID